MNVYPFRTRPVVERAPWGRAAWPFPIGADGADIAAIRLLDADLACDDNGQSVRDRTDAWAADLLGRAAPMGRIPYMARWLGASADSPIHITPAGGAHKIWYIVDADEGTHILRGLRPGATLEEVLSAPSEVDARALLQPISVRRGQCHYIAPGQPHAMGPDVVVAEIQSTDAPSAAREAHRDTALAAHAFEAPDLGTIEKKSHVTSLFTTVTRLITTPDLYVERVRFLGELDQEIPYAELVCWLVLEGTGTVLHDRNASLPFKPGDCVVLPANMRDAKLRTDTDCVWLEITIPVESDLAAYPRPDAEYLRANEGTANHPIPLNISINKKK